MGNPICYDVPKTKVSLINRLYGIFSEGLPFVAPVSTLRTNESELVRGVLQMLQGFSSSLFYWDDTLQSFHVKSGIYLTHLSKTSLVRILSQFMYGATCLQLVELFVKKVEISHVRSPPTLVAFANSVSLWLKRLRSVALKEEMKSAETDTGTALMLLGLANSLSSLCSGAEYLLQVVQGAIPAVYFDSKSSVPAGEMAVHILDHLYNKLNEVCLVQGGEEEAYHMLLVIFVGSSLPYIEGIDSWLYDGTLEDPFEEMFFFANNAIAIDQATFWEKSYVFRSRSYRKLGPGNSVITSDGESLMIDKKDVGDREPTLTSSLVSGKGRNDKDLVACPLFIKDIAKAIVSAGKSLQLIRHVPGDYKMIFDRGDDYNMHDFEPSKGSFVMHPAQNMGGLTLSEVFCISLVGLVGDDSHICKYFRQECSWTPEITQICKCYMEEQKLRKENGETMLTTAWTEKIWCKFLVETIFQKSKEMSIERDVNSNFAVKTSDYFDETKDANEAANICSEKRLTHTNGGIDDEPLVRSFWPENPLISVCREFLNKNRSSWDKLNLSENFHLPPLNDENLREAIFGGNHRNSIEKIDESTKGTFPGVYGTNYNFGFRFGESEYRRSKDDLKILEALYSFPTLLPCFQEDVSISEVMPFQKNSTLASRVLNWILSVEPKATPLPVVIMQECVVVYIKKQVDYVGRHILSKLMNGWRLMDELGVLRAIYLLGSGDLLQQFLIVLFNKLDKGDSWDDDFELNTVLQESIRNSADGMLISAPDSLVVSITKPHVPGDEEHSAGLVSTPRKVRSHCFGINALDLLKFTYKVSWPLELIANLEAIKKYNQVMGFLLKVKRAKFVLDKARRWMWKGRGTKTINHKHHMLVEQKLLHFVDAFHQYVMDRVFHSAWLELCKGMASAGSLDEVIEVHEAYLLSIQRQCFVAPDKLWALIATRIKNILGLALDFYSIQQTLCTGGVAPVIRARCEMEVNRVEKKFDDCIAFLLRVLSFKLNVGQFPHLADLVTRINYNYFYMSDNGNLLTVPGTESTVSKLGKTFPPRPD